MSRALLKYSTDDLGIISVEWTNVTRIYSRATFEVQVSAGHKYYGSLGWRLTAASWSALTRCPSPRSSRWPRSGKASSPGSMGTWISGFPSRRPTARCRSPRAPGVVYRGPATETALEFSTFREDRDDAEQTARLTCDLTQRFLFGDQWSAGLGLGYERNEELDLAGRVTLLGFGAYTFTRSNHLNFWTIDRLVVTREQCFSTDSTSYGLEALIGAVFGAYRYDRPKLDASLTSSLYPSLTVQGRVRWQNDVRLSYELVKDFMVTFTIFDSFDNKPQSADASRNDFVLLSRSVGSSSEARLACLAAEDLVRAETRRRGDGKVVDIEFQSCRESRVPSLPRVFVHSRITCTLRVSARAIRVYRLTKGALSATSDTEERRREQHHPELESRPVVAMKFLTVRQRKRRVLIGSQRGPILNSGIEVSSPSAPNISATNAHLGLSGYHAARIEYVYPQALSPSVRIRGRR